VSPRAKITAGLLLVGVAIAGVLIASARTTSPTVTHKTAVSGSGTVLAGPTVQASPRARRTIGQVEQAFARSYSAYLDGALPASRLAFASITARDQVLSGGRIPAAFRDGRLTVASVGGQAATLYSAQATIEASNRSESYPFTVQLLRQRQGWQIAQVQPPDLSVDDRTRPVPGPKIPRAGRRAAARFAVAYVDYRAGTGLSLLEVTRTAAGQLRARADSLASSQLMHARATLLGLGYGPLEGDEFTATASLELAGRRVRLTFLMSHSAAGGWECDAFL
jgi:hypothetical protein